MSNLKFILSQDNLDFLIRNGIRWESGTEVKYALPVMVHKKATDPLLFEMHSDIIQNANDYISITVRDNKGGISDCYHTFDELYEHRIVNFIAVCRLLSMFAHTKEVWISKKHSDGSEWEGWFIMGIGTQPGEQITYHLPDSRWDECKLIATNEYEKAPQFDGHTGADVLKRLSELVIS